jgi:hypothetical protein
MVIVLYFYKGITYISVIQLKYKLFNLFLSLFDFSLKNLSRKMKNSALVRYRLVALKDNLSRKNETVMLTNLSR